MPTLTAQELCESGGGRPGLPVPNKPYGLCARKATSNQRTKQQTAKHKESGERKEGVGGRGRGDKWIGPEGGRGRRKEGMHTEASSLLACDGGAGRGKHALTNTVTHSPVQRELSA